VGNNGLSSTFNMGTMGTGTGFLNSDGTLKDTTMSASMGQSVNNNLAMAPLNTSNQNFMNGNTMGTMSNTMSTLRLKISATIQNTKYY
jgi:hypothetical protein